MIKSHILGFPRIGSHRQLKEASELYWSGKISQTELENVAWEIQTKNWRIQSDAGLDFITVGDFAWYDHVLDTSTLLGVVPDRFGKINNNNVDLNTMFCMARGQAPNVQENIACEMTKWFNTNYHYMVPEFTVDQQFNISTKHLFNSVDKAIALGYKVKPVILGPLTYLWLGKTKGQKFNKLDLLDRIIPVYNQIFEKLNANNIEWIQIDEPILILDLPLEWQKAYEHVYNKLNFIDMKCLLSSYFGELRENASILKKLPIHGAHIDISTSNKPEELLKIASIMGENKVLSAGIISGRDIWKADLTKMAQTLKQIQNSLTDRLWISSSCSLLHVPVDLDNEVKLDKEIKNWLAFAKQKVEEVSLLAKILNYGETTVENILADRNAALESRRNSTKVHNSAVQNRISCVNEGLSNRHSNYEERAIIQRQKLNLPIFPTTNIGS